MEYKQISVQIALRAWQTHVARTQKFLDTLSDQSLHKEIAPGKNRVSYLLGHLIAVNDGMIALFGLGERVYAHLDEAFLKNPDKSGLEVPEVSVLRDEWKKSTELLSNYFQNLTPDEWFSRHTAMTGEDHQREPWRNKLSVLVNRTNHLAYHLGQLVLVKEESSIAE